MSRSTRSRTRFATGLLAGLVLAVPLAISGSFVGAAATRHIAEMQPAMTTPAKAAAPVAQVAVNRDAKRSRLPLPVTGNGTPAIVDTVRDASTTIVSKGSVAGGVEIPRAAKPRSNATPKGCLSAIGGLASSAATEETTICVADISMIND